MRVIRIATASAPRPALTRLTRGRPRAFAEWEALRRWGKLPAWEREVVGYRLRCAREAAGMTQKDLAARLGVTQQAVAQAERWKSNPTIKLLRRWATACGATVEIRLWSDTRRASQPPERLCIHRTGT
jgi:DNA-binding XRE family transcriptional regulator